MPRPPKTLRVSLFARILTAYMRRTTLPLSVVGRFREKQSHGKA